MQQTKDRLKEAQDLAIKRGEIQVRLTKENEDLRKALRETREALEEWRSIAEYKEWSSTNHRRRTVAVLVRYAHLL